MRRRDLRSGASTRCSPGAEHGGVATLHDARDPMPDHDLAPALLHTPRISMRHAHIINNACVGGEDGLDPSGVWLDLAQPLRPDQLKPFDAVGCATTIQIIEPWKLALVQRDDELAA